MHLQRRATAPTRIDYYLMQIALEVARTNAKHPRKLKLSNFKLALVTPDTLKQTTTPQTRDERKAHIKQSKAAWLAAVVPKPKKGRSRRK